MSICHKAINNIYIELEEQQELEEKEGERK